MIKNITYEDKASIQNDDSVARKNKVTDTDMNEIKEVVNANADGQITMQKDITNIKAKDTEQDSKIVELQTEKAKLETELKEMQEDFYQNSIRGQARGEYIHVEDSSNCRAKIGINGNSEQETRSGKNKLEFINGTYTDKNVTAVVKDGVITLNGNPSSTSFVVIDEDFNYTFKANQRYTISLNNSNIINSDEAKFRFSNGTTIIKDINFNSANKKETFYFTEDTLASNITIRTGTAITYNNFVIKPQLELEETASEWEQGGVSPSPDYQSPVKTVGSNVNLIEETFKGYNLNGNGAFEVSSSFNMQIAKVKANVKYTLNAKTNVLGYYNEKPTLTSVTYNKSRTVLSGDANTIVATRDGYIAIRTMDAEKVKCVEGTEVGEYSKYGQGCVKVTKCNKNLFDKNTTTDGKYIGGNGSIQTQSNIMYSDYIQIKTNINYYITGRSEWSSVVLYDKNKTFLERISTTQPNGVLNITNSNCKYIIINALLTNKDTLQLEEGASTSYEPHKEQSYIIPIQQSFKSIRDTRDTFIKKENKWYERHYVQRLIFNGTEYWNYDKNNNRFYFAKAGNKGSDYIMSSHYLRGDTTKQNNTCEIWSSAILFRDERFTEREDFINMIKAKYDAGTPVYTDIVLQEPQDIECTEEQSKILEELNNARTYKNVTNIYSTDEISPIIDLDYAKDLETLLTSKESEV